ncbi:MAG: Pyruvate, phosphate dikinase [Candidatus Peregrinibacteria bacterium GW2011_GWA2_33_10]|nr:MAG: Pyruvate, phosphate dikinase [Candidatus Peregrinibacteria bacterium GW2011_GWA2_33_10]KKP41083.1 MAG: pyruvate phosphate dikinase, pyruvate,orthophosphate dikinase [Candidatus Peregrinibacteria bacterium GW2011_GWC2_33_13]
MHKYIYTFKEGNKEMKGLLGGKGANLAEMTGLELPVPQGFTITTETCLLYLNNQSFPDNFDQEFDQRIAELEESTGKKFGDFKNPLLVSVRSGAKFSMPGMMDTVLNLGLNDLTVKALTENTQNQRFAYDSYRRFITMFGNVVLGIDHDKFEDILHHMKEEKGIEFDTELNAEDLIILVDKYKKLVLDETKITFPEQPLLQLKLAIEAVFNSWNNERAIYYRKMNGIPHSLGTAVNIQEMVFGNMGDDCGTGVAFTRNPSTGENIFYGEYLTNAQGEDVVAGIRTPKDINYLKQENPKIYNRLYEIRNILENHYRDMQDIEFTIEKGKLFILQTRNGKRTAHAAVKIAHDMIEEGLETKEEALLKINPLQLTQLLHPSLDPKAKKEVIAKGLPASPGAACGKIVFNADDAYEWNENAEKVILVRKETSPEDIHGMNAAQGILTSMGGMTSHAAVVARGMGKCCITGCKDIKINKHDKTMKIGDLILQEGDIITLNGSTGEIIIGEVAMKDPEMTIECQKIMEYADQIRSLKIRVNADTPHDSKIGREFGAEGIGLCRTEHMFFQEERIDCVREMILCKNSEGRKAALKKLLPMQIKDFREIFKEMDGLPVTIRLLDPPLHEFMPESDAKIEKLSNEMDMSFDELKEIIQNLHEVNPMLGHRGCRLGITYPEIYEMQVEAILKAANEATLQNIQALPEIEVPLVSDVREIREVKKIISKVVEKMKNEINFEYKIGTMVELPRACITADQFAKEIDFISFGTNDLTQMTYGLSRDDAGKFLFYYLDNNIMEFNPTETIDREGVGSLMKICVNLARKENKEIDIGICGEHGGDPASVEFCHEIGLNSVSCSPYRVPIARLAAAQAQIKENIKKREAVSPERNIKN